MLVLAALPFIILLKPNWNRSGGWEHEEHSVCFEPASKQLEDLITAQSRDPLCALRTEEDRDDDGDGDDDKRGPVTALIPHQEAEECHKAADMSLRQPTSTLDRYEPHIHWTQTLSVSVVCLYLTSHSGQ